MIVRLMRLTSRIWAPEVRVYKFEPGEEVKCPVCEHGPLTPTGDLDKPLIEHFCEHCHRWIWIDKS